MLFKKKMNGVRKSGQRALWITG